MSVRAGRVRPGEPLWSVAFVLAGAVQGLTAAVFFVLMVGAATYAQTRFGASVAVAGLAASAFVLGAVVSRLLAGPMVDGLGPGRVAAAGAGAFALASVAYLAADDIVVFVAIRAVQGVAMGLVHTAVTAVAMAEVAPTRRAEATGYLAIAATVATALGPLVSGWLMAAHGQQAQFWLAVGLSVPGAGLALVLAGRADDRRSPPAGGVPWSPQVLRSSAVMVLVGVAFSGVLTYLAAHAADLRVEQAAGWFFTVYSAAILASRVSAGRLQDRRGPDAVIYPGLVALLAGLVLLGSAQGAAPLLVAGALIGLGVGTVLSAGQVIAVGQAGPGGLGRAVATHFLLLDLGTAGGPLLLGPMVAAFGYAGMYLAAGGLVLLAAGLYFVTVGRVRAPVPAEGALERAQAG